MALLNDRLSVWEIGFRWAGYDPDKFSIRLPLPIRDNFRCMVHAILHGYLECDSLLLERWQPNHDPELDIKIPPQDHIHYHVKKVLACIEGEKFDRSFLRHAVIQHYQMHEWCDRMEISLPEFWFPTDMDWEYEFIRVEARGTGNAARAEKQNDEGKPRNEARQRVKMACQQISLALWSKNPKLTNKEVAITQEVQQLGGGSEYELETVQGWLSEVDPRDSSNKRGRKRKNNSGLDKSDESQPSEK